MTFAQYERRLFILQMLPQGFPPSEIVKAVREKFKIGEAQAWKDWSTRDEWLPQFVMVTDEKNSVALRVLNDLAEARRLAFNSYFTADNSNAKVGALKTIGELCAREVEIRQSMGLLPRVPERIEGELTDRLVIETFLPPREWFNRDGTLKPIDIQAVEAAQNGNQDKALARPAPGAAALPR